jgi:ribosomal protein L40E
MNRNSRNGAKPKHKRPEWWPREPETVDCFRCAASVKRDAEKCPKCGALVNLEKKETEHGM